MMRVVSVVLVACFSVTFSGQVINCAFAESRSDASASAAIQSAIGEGKRVIGAGQIEMTRRSDRFKSLKDQFQKQSADKTAKVKGKVDELTKSVSLLQVQLADAIGELYQIDTEIAIIPDIIALNRGLLDLTRFYQEQAGIIPGDENLTCGSFGLCDQFQRRRDAISLMISSLVSELIDASGAVSAKGDTIKKFVRELETIRAGNGNSLLRFGLDYFVNQRLEFLGKETLNLEDFSSITTQTSIDKIRMRVEAACVPGAYSYTSILEDLERLCTLTGPWRSDDPFPGSSLINSPGPWSDGPLKSITSEYTNQSAPSLSSAGWFDDWTSCFTTKQNILDDIRAKVAVEIALGNNKTARDLDEQTFILEGDISRLKSQVQRLRDGHDRLFDIREVVNAYSWPAMPKYTTDDDWKKIVRIHTNNLKRMFEVERSILTGGRTLLRRASDEMAPLALASNDSEKLQSTVFSINQKLNTIVDRGVGRLSSEVKLAADTMTVMAKNIRLVEGSAGQGGLLQAITAYESVVRIRTQQMQTERDVELPARRLEVQQKVAKLEADLARSAQQLADARANLGKVTSTTSAFKELQTSLEAFFNIKVSHPVYLGLVDNFIRSIERVKGYSNTIERDLSAYVSRLKTLGGATAQSTGNARSGRSGLTRRAKKVASRLIRTMTAEVDAASAEQLKQGVLSEVVGQLEDQYIQLQGIPEN